MSKKIDGPQIMVQAETWHGLKLPAMLADNLAVEAGALAETIESASRVLGLDDEPADFAALLDRAAASKRGEE